MKYQTVFLEFLLREWLLVVAGAGFALTSVYTRHLPAYSVREMQILFILFTLFVAVKGIEQSGLLLRLSRSMETGRFISVKLVVATFLLSMLITNDAALIVIVPLTLVLNVTHKDILVILEALAANAGSALTPFGNPQNLFIYWFYGLSPAQFMGAIAPYSFIFLFLLVIFSVAIRVEGKPDRGIEKERVGKRSTIYGAILVVVLLTVFRLLPVSTNLLVVLFVALFDRKALRVDYPLLLSFVFFFGLAGNVKLILASEINHSQHVFLLSALASQVMSNVPAALLFARFTTHWKALLWGVSTGGFGSLFGSLANLIAYRLYVTHEDTDDAGRFTTRFLVIGYVAFFIAIGLYFVFTRT